MFCGGFSRVVAVFGAEMDGGINDFFTDDRDGASTEKGDKKAMLMCRDGKLVGVREDGTVLVGDAQRMIKFRGQYGAGSEERSV